MELTFVLKLPSFSFSPGSNLRNNGTYFCTKTTILSSYSWFSFFALEKIEINANKLTEFRQATPNGNDALKVLSRPFHKYYVKSP